MPVIRGLAAADSEHVLALNAGALPNVARLDRPELDRLRALSTEHLVAEVTEKIVGYTLVFAETHAYDGEEFQALKTLIAGPFVYIDQVVVQDSVKGNGVGRSLYDAIERAAVRRGARHACCEVNIAPRNPGSLAFHQRLGFSSAGTLATRDGRHVQLLRKQLSGC